MEDAKLLSQFEDCSLGKEEFNHQNHLRITWLYLSQHNFDYALIRVTQGILAYATSLEVPQLYHETLTRAWVHLVRHAMHHEKNFHDFIAKNQHLLKKELPLQFYSKSLLESERARKEWVEPDLKPLYA